MSDRGAFGKMIGADYEQVYTAIMQDVTQVGLAVSQLTTERKIRIMGALAGSTAVNKERNLLVASAVYSTGEMVRNSHFMPIFVKANLLMMRYFKNRDFAKLDTLRAQLVHFYSPYEMLTTIMEAALQKFDLYFSQWHTLTTMGLRPPEQEEGNMTWMAANEAAMDAATRDQDAARKRAQEAGRRPPPDSIPDFKTAFAEARIMAQKFNTLGFDVEDIELPDMLSLNKKIETLTEELAKAKKDDKTDAGK